MPWIPVTQENVQPVGPNSPGYEYDYVEVTSPLNVTATVEASADTYVSGNPVSYNGLTTIIVECFIPYFEISVSAGGNALVVCLFDGATELGRLSVFFPPSSTTGNAPGGVFARRLTPTAAAHTYSVRAFKAAGAGTQGLGAGAGGTAAYLPGYIRQIKV